MRLNSALKAKFKSHLNSYHHALSKPPLSRELDFVKRTVSSFQNLNFPAGYQTLKVRSKLIHSTPQARFFFSPFQRQATVELSDLVFIYKHFLNNVLDSYRAILVQAKYTNRNKKSWKIDVDQFIFLTQWPRFMIVKPRFNRPFHLKPKTLTWATYGFVGPNATKYPLYYSSVRIMRLRRMMLRRVPLHTSSSFSFHIPSSVELDGSASFLSKFVQGFVGENLLTSKDVRSFVDDLYTIVGWRPDPPGEPKLNDEEIEEGRGFGIVEFIVRTEKEG